MPAFSENLKELRKAKGLTQKQLGEMLGGSERGIQNYELGTSKPYHDLLIALADYFGVSVDYLVGRTDKPEINK
ncbi:MAG: helix-turn-helix domain-containing protein [Oscillospiraceae bacterium]|nr:helix-turn-helix domain-containing protein [Oscillospiraceae bacterium]